MNRSEYFFERGSFANGSIDFCVAGKAQNGDIDIIEPGVVSVGQDCLLFKPEIALFGVFDGSGGATDVGDPKIAATEAARSVAKYFTENSERSSAAMYHAMQSARRSVITNELAGLTTALFMRMENIPEANSLFLAQCGDSMAGSIPEPHYNSLFMDWLVPDQSDICGDPSNILGRVPERIQTTDLDTIIETKIRRDQDRFVVLASDGITGNYRIGDGIDEADIEFAFAPHNSIGTITRLLIAPPIKRTMKRKIDDKSIVLLHLPEL